VRQCRGDSLTQMSLDRQIEELSAIYEEKTDSELLDLHEQREDLTDTAQQALEQVMRERRLTGAATLLPKVTPGKMPEVRSGTILDENEACVWTFDDAFQAREALRLLTAAEIEHRVVDTSQKSGDAFRGQNFQLQLSAIVDRKDLKSAKAVLQNAMGLFPGPEGSDDNSGYDSAGEMTLLSMFDRDDAFTAARALGEAGVSYMWRDGSDEAQRLPDGNTVAIEVRHDAVELATEIVENNLAQD
jgi:hypothetical protein